MKGGSLAQEEITDKEEAYLVKEEITNGKASGPVTEQTTSEG